MRRVKITQKCDKCFAQQQKLLALSDAWKMSFVLGYRQSFLFALTRTKKRWLRWNKFIFQGHEKTRWLCWRWKVMSWFRTFSNFMVRCKTSSAEKNFMQQSLKISRWRILSASFIHCLQDKTSSSSLLLFAPNRWNFPASYDVITQLCLTGVDSLQMLLVKLQNYRWCANCDENQFANGWGMSDKLL